VDPHNSDPGYARVRVRRDALPALERALGPGVAVALARSAALLRDDADALDAWARSVLPDEEDGLDVVALVELPRAVRGRVLRAAATAAGSRALSAVQVAALEALVTDWHGQGPVALPGGGEARRSYGRLLLTPGVDPTSPPDDVRLELPRQESVRGR
jgi:tRNA(Ile)-lysidine synthase